ncbi:MAG: Holliday junction resolvase RuvX [bacterium]
MKKFIGLDLGSRTCGVAISDIMGMIARTYTTIRYKDDNYEYGADEVIKIAKLEGVDTIVLGMPKHMNGDVGIRGKISEDFKKLLEDKANLNVILWDERLTTKAANNLMISSNVRREDRKKTKDELAALLILQNYLDFKK